MCQAKQLVAHHQHDSVLEIHHRYIVPRDVMLCIYHYRCANLILVYARFGFLDFHANFILTAPHDFHKGIDLFNLDYKKPTDCTHFGYTQLLMQV
jgi:hypothetical protein